MRPTGIILIAVEAEYDRSRRATHHSAANDWPDYLVVRDYDEAIDFYVGVLGFVLIEDSTIPSQDKRWVVVAPPGSIGSRLLLARAANTEQASRIGDQTGGRVFLFLHTDDFWRDFHAYKERGVIFVREPRAESYGTVAVFKDLYGNLRDLLEPNAGA